MKWLAIILTALFAGAKLAGVIAWSWWLVFCPVLIYYGFWVALIFDSWLIFLILWAIGFWVSFKQGFKEGLDEHESSKHED